MKNLILISLCLMSLFSCGRQISKTVSYEDYAHNHRILAVLPIESIYVGRMPKLEPEEIEMIEEAESMAFQMSLYNEVTRRSGRNFDNIGVNFQHFATTNDKLERAGISYREAWRLAPDSLARVLEVDAVIRTTVYKQQYLTDLESFGISVAVSVIDAIASGWTSLVFGTPFGARTSDIQVSCSILDGRNGTPIWVDDVICPTDWNQRHDQVIRQVTNRIARRFPYRIK